MKTLFTTAAVALVLSASSALAWNDTNNNNTAIAGANAEANAAAIAAQQQGQSQGQLQGQGQGQDQGQTQSANNRNNINMEGSVAASVGAAACATGVTLGVPAVGVIGGSWSDKDCKIVLEAAAIAMYGDSNMALSHLTHIPRVAETVRAAQTPVAAVSARAAAPAPVAYSFCGMVGDVFTVRVPAGGDPVLASEQCSATR